MLIAPNFWIVSSPINKGESIFKEALKKIQEKEEEFILDIIRRKRNQKLLYLLVLLLYGVAFFTAYLISSGYFSDNTAYTISLPSHYFDY
jgi:predicted nucleic acid-binding Zn ribbon protein